MALPPVTLILGGAASGKSAYAEAEVEAHMGETPAVYIATAEARDAEMREKIAVHRSRRGADWRTVEEPLDLAAAIEAEDTAGGIMLVDCLTLWLSNLLEDGRDIAEETGALVDVLATVRGRLLLVSNEVGLGIAPEHRLGRAFRSMQGALNQRVAAAAGRVVFVAAGLPLVMKDEN